MVWSALAGKNAWPYTNRSAVIWCWERAYQFHARFHTPWSALVDRHIQSVSGYYQVNNLIKSTNIFGPFNFVLHFHYLTSSFHFQISVFNFALPNLWSYDSESPSPFLAKIRPPWYFSHSFLSHHVTASPTTPRSEAAADGSNENEPKRRQMQWHRYVSFSFFDIN